MRHARRLWLHGYAIGVVASLALLVALAAANTRSVNVDWLVGSTRVPLVWLVLAAAIIGWILGLLTSARFQWLTRAPGRSSARQKRPGMLSLRIHRHGRES